MSTDGLSSSLNILILLTVLSAGARRCSSSAPASPASIIVLGLLRQALGTQGLPPSQVDRRAQPASSRSSVMAPTVRAHVRRGASGPYMPTGTITDYHRRVGAQARQPLRGLHVRADRGHGELVGCLPDAELPRHRHLRPRVPHPYEDVDMLTLVPAYILSELKVVVSHRLPRLPAVSRHRHGDCEHAHLHGHAHAPAGAHQRCPSRSCSSFIVDGWQLVVGLAHDRASSSRTSSRDTGVDALMGSRRAVAARRPVCSPAPLDPAPFPSPPCPRRGRLAMTLADETIEHGAASP